MGYLRVALESFNDLFGVVVSVKQRLKLLSRKKRKRKNKQSKSDFANSRTKTNSFERSAPICKVSGQKILPISCTEVVPTMMMTMMMNMVLLLTLRSEPHGSTHLVQVLTYLEL